MNVEFSRKFIKAYRKMPLHIQEAFDKQLGLLMSNPNHPSLNIKKMKGLPGIWEARITKGWRFTFQETDDLYILRNIGTHDVLENP